MCEKEKIWEGMKLYELVGDVGREGGYLRWGSYK